MASMIAKPEDEVLLSHHQLLPKMTAMTMWNLTFQRISLVDIRSIIMEKMVLSLCSHLQALDKELLSKYVHLVEASSELLEVQGQRLRRKEEEILGDLLRDLQHERERCKSLEAEKSCFLEEWFKSLCMSLERSPNHFEAEYYSSVNYKKDVTFRALRSLNEVYEAHDLHAVVQRFHKLSNIL